MLIKEYVAGIGVVKSLQQFDDGAFAAAWTPNQRQSLALPNLRAESV